MERGSVVDAQEELSTQVGELIGRRGRMAFFGNSAVKDRFLEMWMTPSTYAVIKIPARGRSTTLFFPYATLINYEQNN